MKRKAHCPVCNEDMGGGSYEKAILPNRELEQRVLLYKNKVREGLKESLIRLDVLEKKNAEYGNNAEKTNENNTSDSPSPIKRARRSTANYKRDYSSDQDGASDEQNEAMTSNNDDNNGNFATASMPSMNHQQQQQQHQPTRKPTISYHGLKRKKLVELCAASSLPTSGTDAELKQRHSAFILLYNSQCDSLHPMSEKEVVQTVVREEKSRKKEARGLLRSGIGGEGGYMKRLGDSLVNSSENGTSTVTTGSKKVDGEMNKTYKEMIEQLKARKRGETSSNTNSSVPSCIAAAASANGCNGGNNTSMSIVGNVKLPRSSTAPAATSTAASSMSMRAETSSAKLDTTTTSRATAKTSSQIKSISKSTQQKATPSKRSTATTRTATKKQVTLSSTTTTKKKATGGIWKCSICTFENRKYTTANALCEMCNTPRPEKESIVIAIDC